jgi:hypothetical protein
MENIYIVTEFGCNSGYNDMYHPSISVFKNYEDAYNFYNNIKNKIIKMKSEYDIDYILYKKKDSECIIQNGIDNNGAKRPIGIIIVQKECLV